MTIVHAIQTLARSLAIGGVILTTGVGIAQGATAAADHDLDYWQALSHTHYIEEGSKGPILYDFLDPNCPYCHQTYVWLQNPVDGGQLRVRFVIVGFLSPSSKGKAAAILAAPEPLAALRRTEKGFAMTQNGPEGGIEPADAAVIANVQKQLQFNQSRLDGKESELFGMEGAAVPFLVYQRGKKIHYLLGPPDNAQWKDLLDAS